MPMKTTRLDQDNEQYLEGCLFGNEWAFRKKPNFHGSYLQSFKSSGTWKLNSETALISDITDVLALKISYSVFYNNDPHPSDLDKTDTVLATSLVVSY